MTSKRLAFDGMLTALCAVLGYMAIDLNFIKITFESLPVLLSAIMFGPVDGAIVGAAGTFIYQILRYGASATTVLWMFPYVYAGVFLGLYARSSHFRNTNREIFLSVLITKIGITIINTGVMYVDGMIFGYLFPGFISANLVTRFAACIAESIVFGFLIPRITIPLRKHVKFLS